MRHCLSGLSKGEVTLYQSAVFLQRQRLFFLNFNFKLMYFLVQICIEIYINLLKPKNYFMYHQL